MQAKMRWYLWRNETKGTYGGEGTCGEGTYGGGSMAEGTYGGEGWRSEGTYGGEGEGTYGGEGTCGEGTYGGGTYGGEGGELGESCNHKKNYKDNQVLKRVYIYIL